MAGYSSDLIHNFISQIIYQVSLDSWFVQIKICLLCSVGLSHIVHFWILVIICFWNFLLFIVMSVLLIQQKKYYIH